MKDQAIEAAAEVIQTTEGKPSDRITLSNGLVLKIRSVPPFLAQHAVTSRERPKPPTVFIEDKGRTEENPFDPEYVSALEDHNRITTEAAANVLLGAGTEVVTIPDGMYGVDDDGWIEILELAGIEPPAAGKKRYLYWLKYYAVSSVDDLALATEAVARQTGVSEEEVERAVDSFRPRTARRASNGLPAKARRGGNNV